MKNKVLFLVLLITIIIPVISFAHPGNTAADGCHYCWTNCDKWGYVYGTRHCHGGGSISNTTASCPSMSFYDSLSGKCKCLSGYFVSEGKCVSGDSLCESKLGYNSKYDYLTEGCKCDYGYVIGVSGKCISTSSYCNEALGVMSQYNSLTNRCECVSGYKFDGLACVYKSKYSYSCPPNSHTSSKDSTKCTCDDGFQNNLSNDGCIMITKTNDQLCEDSFGENSEWDEVSTGEDLRCICKNGYTWNSARNSCIIVQNKNDGKCGTINGTSIEKNSFNKKSMSFCLSGSILDFQIWNSNYWWRCKGGDRGKDSNWCMAYIKNQ